jgi:hypothetical protein
LTNLKSPQPVKKSVKKSAGASKASEIAAHVASKEAVATVVDQEHSLLQKDAPKSSKTPAVLQFASLSQIGVPKPSKTPAILKAAAISPAGIVKALPSIASPKALTQTQNKESLLHERISVQYKQLQAYLRTLTTNSIALINDRNLRGPLPVVGGLEQSRYNSLMAEHRATHIALQKRLLRSAETTLRLMLDGEITAEEARTDLKASMKTFGGTLYDTLQRQEMERDTFLSQYRYAGNDSIRNSKVTEDGESYPCQSAFEHVEDICATFSRPVGRPKSLSPIPPSLR